MRLGIYTGKLIYHGEGMVRVRYLYDATGLTDDYIRWEAKSTGARISGTPLTTERIPAAECE